MAEFAGFAAEDFEVFETPGFAARMPVLRERVKPKLEAIGAVLKERLSEAWGDTLYPHVAQHLRRTVNAPEETWAAFARNKRAYKPVVHLRVAVSAEKVRVVVFVEDDADDKLRFAQGLQRNAEPLSRYLAHHPAIRAYDIRDADGEALRGSHLTVEVLHEFAKRLQRVKGQHAAFGIQYDREHHVLLSGPEFLDAIVETAENLKPFYDCGTTDGFVYHYAPDIINIPHT